MKNKKVTFFFALLLALCATTLIAPAALSIDLPTNSGLPNPTGEIANRDGPVVQVVVNVLKWILTVFVLLAVIGFVITGIQYLMSFGSSSAVETAKRNFVYSTIAIAVVAGSLIILYTIQRLLIT